MSNKIKRFLNQSKTIKFTLLSSFFILIPLINNNNFAKAGLEFQWEQNSGYRSLKWFQKNKERRARNTIFFFLRPSDRQAGLLKINMKIPKTFDSNLQDKVSICQVKIGGFETRTKCIKDIPADIEINKDKNSLDIYPYSPIPSNKDSYAVVFNKIYNPKKTGLKQLHSYGQYIGSDNLSSYLGSWTIVID